MKSFSNGFLKNQKITQNLVQTIRLLGEFKGKQELFKQQTHQILENLRETAIIQSVESSNRIEGITALPKRFEKIVLNKILPENRSEQEIAGYRNVLNTIHSSFENIPFTKGVVLQFHRDLYSLTPVPGGNWKNSQNEIQETLKDETKTIRFHPVTPFQTPIFMETLHDEFDKLLNNNEIEPLLLVASYVFDFLCIHPFNDGNGRISRLITTLLLHKSGYEVVRFISLEKIIEQTKETYYEALYKSSQNWHEANHSLLPWWEYFLGVLVTAYKDFEQKKNLFTGVKGAKTSMVLEAIEKTNGSFSVRQLLEKCPLVGIDLVRKILKNQKELGEIECLGKGTNAVWKKID